MSNEEETLATLSVIRTPPFRSHVNANDSSKARLILLFVFPINRADENSKLYECQTRDIMHYKQLPFNTRFHTRSSYYRASFPVCFISFTPSTTSFPLLIHISLAIHVTAHLPPERLKCEKFPLIAAYLLPRILVRRRPEQNASRAF